MTKSNFTISLTLLAVLSGCTEQKPPPAYVSPLEFKNYNCKQIAKEMTYISSQLNITAANNQTGQLLDAAIMAYGISRGYGFSSENEDPAVAQLRAKYTALHQASIDKNCD